MTISRAPWTQLCIAAFSTIALLSTVNAKDDLPKPVRKVLSEEAQFSGSQWNRRQQLGEELFKAKTSDEELYWQAGLVKVSGKWLPFEEALSPEPVSSNVRDYLDRRAGSEQSVQSQSALASWCSKHGLGEQSQAHLYRAMMLAPKNADRSQFYQRMGYVQVGQKWLSRQDAFDARRELVEYLEQLEAGTPAVSRFADELEANKISESSLRERLMQLATPKKIAALELVLAPRSERSGQAAVEALRQIPSYQASQALGRIAVYSPWLFVRDSAVDGLKVRPWGDFVPQWLSMMSSPISSEFQRVTSGRSQGILCLYYSERNSEIELRQLLIWTQTQTFRRRGGPNDRRNVAAYNSQVLEPIIQSNLRIQAELAERQKFALNDEVEQINERVSSGLRTVTLEQFGDSPNCWWDWWQEYSTLPTVTIQAKPVVVIVKEDREVKIKNLPPPPPPVPSCLVAGTLVQTERGLVAIETIQPGDRVLSKNIETGELDYKVVLHTTVREPIDVIKFAIGDETIQATQGHHFWVSGRGWCKTRELAAKQPLHTPIGAVKVASTEPAEPSPTYNLVVADFHTYFVGKNAILSHDVLSPKPTNKRVPGLSED